MAEIEKKYSDYQTSECDTQEAIEVVDERLCPTCQINPNWKLPAAHWSAIQEAYLNESVCEYHVRVYENERATFFERADTEGGDLEEAIKSLGVERILVDLDKPLNDGTRQQLMNAAFIVDTFQEYPPSELGLAYLVGVPAFNMDQILPNDSEDAQPSAIEEGVGGEIIIDLNGFNRKLRQLRTALGTYGMFYTSAQNVGAGFVIRQKSEETLRINYGNTKKKLKNFKSELNDRLALNGYPRIGNTGVFKTKRFKKIKFVFRDNGKPYDLKRVYVLDSECDKYKKIPIPNGHLLRKPSMRVVYHFLENFNKINNDITAKETKPWLDFTLENFYPKYVVDYRNLGDMDETKIGLECLLEIELGIGNGQVVDALAAEIMSAFDTIEKQMAEEACRSLGDLASKSSTSLAQENNKKKKPSEERAIAMKARYKREYQNKILNHMIRGVNNFQPESHVTATRENLFSVLDSLPIRNSLSIPIPSYKYKDPNGVVKHFPPDDDEKSVNITSRIELESNARLWASTKFDNLEGGSFGNQIQNSPHFDESMEAAREVLTNFENTYIQSVKDSLSGGSEVELADLIPTIGTCGISKIAGKAIKCLASGVSFDDFLDMLIEKTFDFMEVNTLGLFLNGLPYSFRAELNREIEKQFGNGVDISKLLGIKLAEGGGQKMKDFVKSRPSAKRVLKLFEKYKFPGISATEEEKLFLESRLGKYQIATSIYSRKIGYEKIERAMSEVYDRNKKAYKTGEPKFLILNDKKIEYKKYKKYILRVTKEEIKNYKKEQEEFLQAKDRIASSMGLTTSQESTTVYTVKSGDTLSSIAEQFLGDSSRYMEIAASNGITNASLIEVGQQLIITIDQPLEEIDDEPQGSTSAFPEGTLLMTGSRGELVSKLQLILIDKGYNLSEDGKYEGETKAAVEQFQKDNGLNDDGKAGDDTLAALGSISNTAATEEAPQSVSSAGDVGGNIDITESDAFLAITFLLSNSKGPAPIDASEYLVGRATPEEIKEVNKILNTPLPADYKPPGTGTSNPTSPPTPEPTGSASESSLPDAFIRDLVVKSLDFLEDKTIYSTDVTDEDELNEFEKAALSFQETALGVKVDAVFDIIFDFVIDSIMDYFSLDELFQRLRSYPAVDFAMDKIEELFLKPCPVAPVIYPPANDFMKSLKVDVCDPTFDLETPKIVVPNISIRFKFEQEFGEIFRESIIKLLTDIVVGMLKRLMST